MKAFKYIKIILIALIVLAVIVTISKALNGKKTSGNVNYTEITSVNGCTLLVPKEFSDQATAVLEISDRISFTQNGTYSYTNGEDLYMLFNINNFIIVAKKGTLYNLSKDTSEVAANSLNGIWLTPTGKVTKENGKYSVPVEAQVVITNQVYNDFDGTLTTIEKDGTEWALLTGFTSESKTFANVENYMIDSLTYCKENSKNSAVVALDLESGTMEEVALAETPVITVEPIEEVLPTEESSEPVIIAEEVETPVSIEDKKEDTPMEESNQKNYEKELGKAYSSDIYTLLNISDMGLFKYLNDTGEAATGIVCVKEKLGSARIEELLNDNGEFTEPSAGTHYEGIVYDYLLTGGNGYVNVKILGFDGEALKYKGITYSKRTKDIAGTESDGWNKGYICYYEVPNGCDGYVLRVGESMGEQAFYKATADLQ